MFSGVRKITNRVRFGFAVLLVMAIGLSTPLSAAAAGPGGDGSISVSPLAIVREPNIVSRVTLSPRSPNILMIKQLVTITFNYNTTWPTGIIVTATPFTGTKATSNSTSCRSKVLPVGHGTGTCAISVNTGNVSVTSLRFQVWDNTMKALLYQTLLPVNYMVSSTANMVWAVTTTPAAPAIQVVGKGISVKFNYRTNHPGGVRILALPYTGGNPTANSVTCTASVYPTGSGSGTCRFVVNTAAAAVTNVIIQMWDTTQTTKLAQFNLALAFRYRSQPTMLTRASLSPGTPNIVRLGDKVFVHFNYQTDQAAGVIVEAVPFTGAVPSANATVTASAVLPTGTGIGSCSFQIMSGTNPTVTSVRFQVFNSTHTGVLFTTFYPVQYQFH